jgi:hypothetical protein
MSVTSPCTLIEFPVHFLVDRAVDLLSLFRCRRVDLQTVCPVDLRILVVKAELTSVAGPKYCPKVN